MLSAFFVAHYQDTRCTKYPWYGTWLPTSKRTSAVPCSERRNKTISLCVNTPRRSCSSDSCGLQLQHAAMVRWCSLKLLLTSRSARSRKPIPAYEDYSNVPMFVVPTFAVKSPRVSPIPKKNLHFGCS